MNATTVFWMIWFLNLALLMFKYKLLSLPSPNRAWAEDLLYSHREIILLTQFSISDLMYIKRIYVKYRLLLRHLSVKIILICILLCFLSVIKTLIISWVKLKNFSFSLSVLLQYLYSMMPLRNQITALGNSQKILMHIPFHFYKFISPFPSHFLFFGFLKVSCLLLSPRYA